MAHLLTMLAVGYDEQWLPDTFPVERCRADAAGGEELLRAAPPVVDEWAEDVDEDDDEEDDSDDDSDDDEDEEDRYSYYESLSDEDANALYSYVVLAAYDAVRAGVPLFRSLVAGDDPALRTAAAYALAWFPEDAAGSLAALAPATVPAGDDAESLLAAGCALVALGLLGGTEDAVAAATVALADDRELVRWGAAVALAGLQGPYVGREAVAELLTWAGGPAGERDDVPFLRGDIGGVAALALRHLGEAHADVVFDALLSRLREVSGMPAVTVLYELLRRAWPDGKRPEDTPFAALTAPQQRAVRLLAESPSTWRYGDFDGLFGNFTMLLSQYGLPRDPDQMRAYIAPA
jgi:hypothetical protein